MLDALITRVPEKTGLSPEQSQAAVHVVLGFLKEKLPAPLASHLDSLAGELSPSGGEGLAGEATAILGSLFGKK